MESRTSTKAKASKAAKAVGVGAFKAGKGRSPSRAKLDQFLLGLNHSGISRFAAGLKDVPGASQSVDLVAKIGQTVLNSANVVRDSLVRTVQATARHTRRPLRKATTATHSATQLATKKTKTKLKKIIRRKSSSGTK